VAWAPRRLAIRPPTLKHEHHLPSPSSILLPSPPSHTRLSLARMHTAPDRQTERLQFFSHSNLPASPPLV
jgi:hypothetical protein